MTTYWKSLPAVLALVIGLSTIPASSPLPTTPQTSNPSHAITADHLHKTGLHLPSYMPTMDDLMRYQDKLPVHQQLLIEWDSIPGQRGVMHRKDVEGIPLSPNFTLLARKQGLTGGAGKSLLTLSEDSLIVVASTATGEVRGLAMPASLRIHHGEGTRTHPAEDLVFPKIQVQIALPDDPTIRTITFFVPQADDRGEWTLVRAGAINLGDARNSK